MAGKPPDFSGMGYRAVHRFEGSEVYVVQGKEKGKRCALKRVKTGDDVVPVFKALQGVQGVQGVMKVEGIDGYTDKQGDTWKCMLLELCENGTLADHLGNVVKRKGLFSEPNITHVIRQLHAALKALHSHGTSHRNLSPKSIFFSSAVRLVLGSIQPEFNTKSQETQQYLPPECFSCPHDEINGEKVDLFSLGVVLLDICQIPHVISNQPLHERITTQHRAETSRIRSTFKQLGYSSGLAYLTIRLLDKNPADRYTLADIERFLNGEVGGGFPDFSEFGFKCKSLIGKGGSAKVFSVEEESTGNCFALKQTHILDDSQATKDLEKEKELLQRAAHPSIVNYHSSFYRESDRGERFFCIVMELCSNSLDGLMGEQGNFVEPTIVSYLKQLCSAMNHLHSLKIFHRDITPKNILVTADNQLKLGDFGISNTFGELASHPRHTRIGTPNYVSPEVFAGASQSEKIDMWGIGAIALDLTGSLHLNSKQDLHERVRLGEDEEHDSIRKQLAARGYSDKFADLCCQLLQTNPDRRPSAEEVLLILEKEF